MNSKEMLAAAGVDIMPFLIHILKDRRLEINRRPMGYNW